MVPPSILHISNNIDNIPLTFDDIHSFCDHCEGDSFRFEVLIYQFARKYKVEWTKVRHLHMQDDQQSYQ